MSKFNWNDHKEINVESKKFNWDDHPEIINDKPSVSGSLVRQGLQGFTGALSDEIAGGVEAAGRAIGIEGLNKPAYKDGKFFPETRIAEGGPTLDYDELKKAYQEGRNYERHLLAEDSKENPTASLIANLAGGITSPINKITKGMSIAKSGATLGAAYGFGSSDADNTADLAIDTAKGAGLGVALGKTADKLSKALMPAVQSGAIKIRGPIAKSDKNKILDAAKRLGIDVTPAMLDDTGFVERLESSLAKSPSFMGQNIAKKQRAVTDRLTEAVEDLTKEATNLSSPQLGEKFKSGITAKIGERLDPISSVFDEVSQNTKFIPVTDKSKNAVINNIRKIDEYALTEGAGKPSQYVDLISRIENADQVKTAMTMLNADIRAAQGAEKQVLIGIKNKLGALEENSITRAAIQQAREAGMRETTGKKIGSSIVNDLRDARANYRSLIEDLGGLAENARIKTNKGPSAFLDSVESIPSERIQDKFFNVDNNRALKNLKDKFPEEFNLLRQGKLKDIGEAAIDNSANGQGRISSQKFLKEVRNLSPEAKEHLFQDAASTIDDITTIQNSLPRNFNPSGTASELSWKDALSRNALDIPQYLLYKGASSNLGKRIGSNLSAESIDSVRDVTASAAMKLSNPTSRLAAESMSVKTPLRGYDKWAEEGVTKVVAHDSSLSKEELDKLKNSKKGKQLLIQASDLKPNSKAMEKIVEKIRSAQLEENQ